MHVTVHAITSPQFIRSLKALKGMLRKAQVWADSKKVDPTVLLQTRLAPDMFPLSKQIQIACDTAKFTASRLTGLEAPTFDDKETTLEQFNARIDATIKYLETTKPEQYEGFEKKQVRFPWYPGKHLEGHAYLVQHALPNFYFHVTAAYAILRSNGIDLGKGDFLGEQDWKND